MNTMQTAVTEILVNSSCGSFGVGVAGSLELNDCGRRAQVYHCEQTAEAAGEFLGGLIRMFTKAGGMVVIVDVDARHEQRRADGRKAWARAKYGR